MVAAPMKGRDIAWASTNFVTTAPDVLLGLPGHSCQPGRHIFVEAETGYICVRCADHVDELKDDDETGSEAA